MHTTIFIRFLKWARIVGRLSCPYAIFLLNHSLFPPKSCDVFKPVIIDQLFDNFLVWNFTFYSSFAEFVHFVLIALLIIGSLCLIRFFLSSTEEIQI